MAEWKLCPHVKTVNLPFNSVEISSFCPIFYHSHFTTHSLSFCLQLHLVALQGFSKLSEPLEALLTILENCPGKQKGRSQTLGHRVLIEFQTWFEANPQVGKGAVSGLLLCSTMYICQLSPLPPKQVNLSSLSEQEKVVLQQRALALLTDTHPSFVDSLINIYELSSLDTAILQEHIVWLYNIKCYKEVCT